MNIRKATLKDVTEVVKLLVTDKLGQQREHYQIPLPQSYFDAFNNILNDHNQELMVIEANDEIIGTFQLSFIQYMTYQGGIRAQIEAVRIRDDHRGKGIGETMIRWAINRAKEKKAHLIQLTTDKQRPEAARFYERLGFKATHEGMKLHFA